MADLLAGTRVPEGDDMNALEAMRKEFEQWSLQHNLAPCWRTGVPAKIAIEFALHQMGYQGEPEPDVDQQGRPVKWVSIEKGTEL